MTHTIEVLECGKDVVFMRNVGVESKIHIDRKGWPDTQILPDRSSPGAGNSEIETAS